MFLQSVAVTGRACISSAIARRGCFVSPTTKIRLTGCRSFSSSRDWSVYYQIEANNAAREDATQLTVSGPDIDGILASMTVALAVRGCSLVELHAAKSVDTASHHQSLEAETPMIHDVFYVVDRSTGNPFEDDELEPLAKSLLESLKSPMNLIGVGGVGMSMETYKVRVPETPVGSEKQQIKIVKSSDKP